MSAVWLTIAALAVGTAAIKSVGPLAVGGRDLPPRVVAVIALLAPALLAALVVQGTFVGEHGTVTVDARAAGAAAAVVAIAARAPITVVVVAAAGTAALLRALA